MTLDMSPWLSQSCLSLVILFSSKRPWDSSTGNIYVDLCNSIYHNHGLPWPSEVKVFKRSTLVWRVWTTHIPDPSLSLSVASSCLFFLCQGHLHSVFFFFFAFPSDNRLLLTAADLVHRTMASIFQQMKKDLRFCFQAQTKHRVEKLQPNDEKSIHLTTRQIRKKSRYSAWKWLS